MTTILMPGPPQIAVRVKRSARAKRLSLRVSSLDGRVTLTAPPHISHRKIERFVFEKEAWLRQNINQVPDLITVEIGGQIPVLGQAVQLIKCADSRIWQQGNDLYVPEHKSNIGARVLGHLKTVARDQLTKRSDFYAAELGQNYSKLSVRDTRSRWGSCSQDRALMFSWRLIMAPQEVLDYVVAHEVAHLEHMNHSERFWAVVEQLYGDYQPARLWLREKGAELHRYRFAD